MNRYGRLTVAVLLAAAISATSAVAQVALRFEPATQQLAVGETGSLSVFLDDALDVRTIELWVHYDPELIASLNGQAGQLFVESGCTLFPIFEDDGPGAFYGGAVAMGPTCFVTGPGELYRWEFKALADGFCSVQVDSVVLYDPLAVIYADVTLPGTAITVGDVSAVGAPAASEVTLSVTPNPFNPQTSIRFTGPADAEVAVAVFDLTGRRVTSLWRGRLGREPASTRWDGRDDRGRAVAGGVYLFRISGAPGQEFIAKGILLR